MFRVLVVDDDEYVRTRCQRELRKRGFEVLLAASGGEALKIFEADEPHIVVLDIRMPGIDGIEVMGRMLSGSPRTPIILNTGHPGYQDSFLTWSADAYVVKTADMAELVAQVEEALRRRYHEADDLLPFMAREDTTTV